jgi:hypothetical protein
MRFFLAACAMLLGSLLGWLSFMIADNVPPYEYDVANSHVIPSPAGDGEQITIMWKLSKVNRVCPGVVHRILYDPKTRVVLASYDPTPAAISSSIKDGYLNRTFLLPRGALPSGMIGYKANVCYECNLYQKVVRPLCVATPDLIFQLK